MISIVLYGRNDSYGYNLHKRAALSFNCMAEVLDDEDDEILFVDYNTPDDFPTFPEAIQDTLTPRAKRRLRILRARPHIHERYRSKTRLVALEPISRNIAVRRSNPNNRWILSTNTDMIFVPVRGGNLNDIVRDLPRGFYHAPRFEIPETLWEGLDRFKAAEAIGTVRDWGWALHLNEIVKGANTIIYDGPGDFQLMDRKDLFDISGFDEEMILGWHVDSNIAKRLFLLYGGIGDLGQKVFGYHCDHTRQITPMHSHVRIQNDWRRFIDDVDYTDLPAQKTTWGCANDEIEEVFLRDDSAKRYIMALSRAIGPKLETPPVSHYTGENYNKTDYDPRHVLPFLSDLFACTPRHANVAWAGFRRQTLELFGQVWTDLGFSGAILLQRSALPEGLVPTSGMHVVDEAFWLANAQAFVIDFGVVDGQEPGPGQRVGLVPRLRAALDRLFMAAVQDDRARQRSGSPLRKIVAVNAINNDVEGFVTTHLATGWTPYSTRMRHGYIMPLQEASQDWTSALQPGDAGVRAADHFASRSDRNGVVIYGPYRFLHSGRYRLTIALAIVGEIAEGPADDILAALELRTGRIFLEWRALRRADFAAGTYRLEFEIWDDLATGGDLRLETLVRSQRDDVGGELRLISMTCDRVGPALARGLTHRRALEQGNILPLLTRCGTARWDRNRLLFSGSVTDVIAYGLYWELPAGTYEVALAFDPDPIAALRPDHDRPALSIEVISQADTVRMIPITVEGVASGLARGRFTIPAALTEMLDYHIQVRIVGRRGMSFACSGFRLAWLGAGEGAEVPGAEENWLVNMSVQRAGHWLNGSVGFVAARRGLLAEGPGISLPAGRYVARLKLALDPAPRVADLDILTLEVMSAGRLRARKVLTGRELAAGEARLAFLVGLDEKHETRAVDVRLRTTGAASGRIDAVAVSRTGPAEPEDRPWLDPALEQEWLPALDTIGGTTTPRGTVELPGDAINTVVYGPCWQMEPRPLKVTIRGEVKASRAGAVERPAANAQTDAAQAIVAADILFDSVAAAVEERVLPPGSFTLELTGSSPDRAPNDGALGAVQICFAARGPLPVEITSVSTQPIEGADEAWTAVSALPFMTAIATATGTSRGFVFPTGSRAILLAGPGWHLAAGSYTVVFTLETGALRKGLDGSTVLFGIDVVAGDRVRALGRIRASDLTAGPVDIALDFASGPDAWTKPFEFRLWSSGLNEVTVRSVILKRRSEAAEVASADLAPEANGDWLPFLPVARCGALDESGSVRAGAEPGPVVGGSFLPLPPQRHKITFDLRPVQASGNRPVRGSVDVAVGQRVLATRNFDFSSYRTVQPVSVEVDLTGVTERDLRIALNVHTTGEAPFKVTAIRIGPAAEAHHLAAEPAFVP